MVLVVLSSVMVMLLPEIVEITMSCGVGAGVCVVFFPFAKTGAAKAASQQPANNKAQQCHFIHIVRSSGLPTLNSQLPTLDFYFLYIGISGSLGGSINASFSSSSSFAF